MSRRFLILDSSDTQVVSPTGLAIPVNYGTAFANTAEQTLPDAGGLALTMTFGDHFVAPAAYTMFATTDPVDGTLTSLQGPHGKAEFSSVSPIQVDTINAYSRVTTLDGVEPGGIAWFGQTTAPDGSTVINFLKADTYVTNYSLTYDHVNGSMIASQDLTMAAGLVGSDTQAFHYSELLFRLKPFGNAEDCRVLIGLPQPTVFSLMQMGTEQGILSVDSLYRKGGPRPSRHQPPADPDDFAIALEPSGSLISTGLTFLPAIYVWNHVTKEGCLFRIESSAAFHKQLTIVRDEATNDLTISLRQVPQDNTIGLLGASDIAYSYGLEVRPMTGDWYDAVKYMRERAIAEGSEAYAAGRIRDRADYPDRVKNAAVFGAMTYDVGTATRDFDLYVENTANIVSAMRINPDQMVMSLYDYWEGYIGDDPPTVIWDTGAADMVSAIYDSGVTTLLYTIPVAPSVWDGTGGLPPSLGLNNDLPVNEAGEKLTIEKFGYPYSLVGAAYTQATWANEANTKDLYRYILRGLVSGPGLKFHGIYDDAGNVFSPPPDENPNIPSDQRGIGSLTYNTANRRRFDLWREVMEEPEFGLVSPVTLTEHPTEHTIGAVDMIFNPIAGAVGGASNSIINYASYMWSDYVVMASFASIGNGPKVEEFAEFDTPGFATVAEVFSRIDSQFLHAGQLATLIRFFSNNLDVFFPDDMDAGYLEWRDFLHTAFVAQLPILRHYRQSIRLRELPTSPMLYSIDKVVAGDTTVIEPDWTKVRSSVWYDEDADTIGILISNWSMNSGHPYVGLLSDTLTLADFPELGGSPRDVKVLNFGTGEAAQLPQYDGAGSYTFSIPTAPSNVYMIELVPASTPGAGQLPEVNAVQKSLLVTWPDDMNDTLDSYSVVRGPGGSTTVTTKSAFYLDTAVYNDTTAMETVTFAITANQSSLISSSVDSISTTSYPAAKWPVAPNSICMITGNVTTVGGSAGSRPIIRLEPAPEMPMNSTMSSLFSVVDLTARANFNGDFVIPAPRGSLVHLGCPNADYHVKVVVPDQENANLGDLETVRIDSYTNN